VGELCRYIKDKQKSHGYKMGGFQGTIEIIMLSHRLQRGATHEIEVPLTAIGTRHTRIHVEILKSSHHDRYLFGRIGGVGEIPWRTIH
jgi:hypothetical protein